MSALISNQTAVLLGPLQVMCCAACIHEAVGDAPALLAVRLSSSSCLLRMTCSGCRPALQCSFCTGSVAMLLLGAESLQHRMFQSDHMLTQAAQGTPGEFVNPHGPSDLVCNREFFTMTEDRPLVKEVCLASHPRAPRALHAALG